MPTHCKKNKYIITRSVLNLKLAGDETRVLNLLCAPTGQGFCKRSRLFWLSLTGLTVFRPSANSQLALPLVLRLYQLNKKVQPKWLNFFISGRRDSNSRHFAWEANILPLNYTRIALSLYIKNNFMLYYSYEKTPFHFNN